MREIKFRVFLEDFNEMFYDVGIINDELHVKIDRYGFDGLGDYRDYAVMQWTGLKDKNGKEIYEEDILYDPVTNDFYVVTWDDSYAMFFLKNTKEDADAWDYDFVEYDGEVGNDLYIVGNVYANPELLNS